MLQRLSHSFIFFVLTYSLYLTSEQVESSDCTLNKDSVKETDRMKKLKEIKGEKLTVEDEKYKYEFGICTKPEDGHGANVGAVQHEKNGNRSHVLGYFNDTSVIGGSGWMIITYNSGDNYTNHCNNQSRRAMLMILCDQSVHHGQLQIIEERTGKSESSCFYLFELGSSVVCPEEPKELSSGSVFCIVFFTVVLIYLIFGFMYKRIVVGAKGLEQIPNYSFWKDLGSLQADGCAFVCRCGQRHDNHSYRDIDEELAKDEDRDDQLLTM